MKAQLIARFESVFGSAPQRVTQAPGRIEVIGNHTDYNGGTVLGASIDRGVWVALRLRPDGQRNFASDHHPQAVRLDADDFRKATGETSWVNYPLGVLASLSKFDLKPPVGFG